MSRLDWILCALVTGSIFVGTSEILDARGKQIAVLVIVICIVALAAMYASAWWSTLSRMTYLSEATHKLNDVVIDAAVRSQSILLSFYTPQRQVLGNDQIRNSNDLAERLRHRIQPYVLGVAIGSIVFLIFLILEPAFREGRGFFGNALHQPIFLVLVHAFCTYLATWASSFFLLVQFARFKGR